VRAKKERRRDRRRDVDVEDKEVGGQLSGMAISFRKGGSPTAQPR